MSSIQSVQSSSVSASSAPAGTLRESVAVSVLEKALNAESSSVLTLVNSVAAAAPALSASPPHLGTRFDRSA